MKVGFILCQRQFYSIKYISRRAACQTKIFINYVVKLIEEVRARWRISQRQIVYQNHPAGLNPMQSGFFEFVFGVFGLVVTSRTRLTDYPTIRLTD